MCRQHPVISQKHCDFLLDSFGGTLPTKHEKQKKTETTPDLYYVKPVTKVGTSAFYGSVLKFLMSKIKDNLV